MRPTSFRNMSPWAQFIFSGFIVIATFLIVMLVGVVVGIPFFGIQILSDPGVLTDYSNPESISMLKYFQTIQAFGFFIIPSFILAYLFGSNTFSYLQLRNNSRLQTFLLILLLVFISNPVINFVGHFNAKLSFPDFMGWLETWMRNKEDVAAEITTAFLNVNTVRGLLFNIFMIGILPALGEELLFRGVVQRILTRWANSYHWGIWLAAILFSALHLQFYGFLPRMLLGALFGYLLVWTGSLWVPIAAHFINNTLAVVFYYFQQHGTTTVDMEKIGTEGNSVFLTAISVVLCYVILQRVFQLNRGKQLTY